MSSPVFDGTRDSWKGAIGYIMDGSSLQDACKVAYVHTATKEMSGHIYSRAVIVHTLCNLALGPIILTRMKVSKVETLAVLEAFGAASFDNTTENYPEDLSVTSTKSAERLSRAKRHTVPKVLFNHWMTATMP
ncbi:hypothetical protein ILUMI_25109 [Ignelater luminosus]|uniref:Uncharacterized protein n=1 Tax=Ignelater luminosus TaxID=2038154 RepID=A0A8K0C577_IGNLU|nr:hypothetical protein ILUMI_25109 [Ignelater luminosus]